MNRFPDEPTGITDDDDDQPTRNLGEESEHPTARFDGPPEEETRQLEEPDEAETRQLNEPDDPEPATADTDILLPGMATGSAEEMRTRRLAEEGPNSISAAPPRSPGSDTGSGGPDSRRGGLWMLGISILASVLLIGAYVAAGGLDYKPAAAADPCDPRPWTNPGNLEETAQQFAFSATDGAACELGVSREELIGALADEQSRADFAEEHGLSDSQIEDALRSGLNRAIDDAENADAISSLVAAGLRVVVRTLPMDQLIPLLEDASGLLGGDSLDGITGIVDGVTDQLNGTGGSLGDSLPDGLSESLPGDITDKLREQLPEDLDQAIPESLDERVQKELDGILNQ